MLNRGTRHIVQRALFLCLALAACDVASTPPQRTVRLDRSDLKPGDRVVADYGAFVLIAVEGPSEDVIRIEGYPIRAADPEAAYATIPPGLRKSGLSIVQLIGPVKDEWIAQLDAEGVERIQYIPDNAYVVRAKKILPHDFLQLVVEYSPAFKIAPDLREPGLKGRIDLTVQVIDGPSAKATVHALEKLSAEIVLDTPADQYRNIAITADAAAIDDLANLDDVFAVERRQPREREDEAQGQIIAGSFSGAQAVLGSGYLAWLAGRGFTATQFTTFATEIVDDTHLVTGHPDLASGRVAFQLNPSNNSNNQRGHGFLNTHILGGLNSGTGTTAEDARGFNYGLGIAPFAQVAATDIFGATFVASSTWENTAYILNARISSNSWSYSGAGTLRYESNAQGYDRIVRDARTTPAGNQQLAVVFAAANRGPNPGTVPTPANAKNVLTVGASENDRAVGATDGCGFDNTDADDCRDMIAFSSRGPVNLGGGDGRIKPDIVAPGTHIQAGIPQANFVGGTVCDRYFPPGQTLYGWSTGTSHACPAAAGGATLLYQDFLNRSLPAPSPALLKALLMSSANYLTGVGANDTLPSNSQGTGRMDLGRALDGAPRLTVDQTVTFGATGNSHVVTGVIPDSSRPFRVSLVWTDAPGAIVGAPWVNDLDLTVTIGGSTYRGNVFSGATSITGGAADTRNNAEHVFLPAGTSGVFTVTITASNIAGEGVPGNADVTDQDFALVVYNATPRPTISALPSPLVFTGAEGGANPASQALAITNSGGGTLAWSAVDDQPWLSLSVGSGTAPASPSVSVSTAGLTAGTYNANITVSGTNATNTPLIVPVTLTVTAPSDDLIVNGGFESTLTPWVRQGAALVHEPKGPTPFAGLGYVTCGGTVNNATAFVYQEIAIPAGAPSANLTYRLRATTTEPGPRANDRLLVEARNTMNAVLGTVGSFSNLDASPGYVQPAGVSLLPYAGQTIRLFFRCSTNGTLPTTFFIDQVSAR